MISPTACGALFLLVLAPPRSPRRASWDPGGALVEPSWNLTSGPPRTTPEPIWAETQSLQLLGNNNSNKQICVGRTKVETTTAPQESNTQKKQAPAVLVENKHILGVKQRGASSPKPGAPISLPRRAARRSRCYAAGAPWRSGSICRPTPRRCLGGGSFPLNLAGVPM